MVVAARSWSGLQRSTDADGASAISPVTRRRAASITTGSQLQLALDKRCVYFLMTLISAPVVADSSVTLPPPLSPLLLATQTWVPSDDTAAGSLKP